MENVKLGDWVKVIREDRFTTEKVIYGEVCCMGFYKDSPIITIQIIDEKFLTVAQELIVEVRTKDGK